jgi:hypothetical protein
MSHNTHLIVDAHPSANREDINALRRVVRAGDLQGVQNTFSDWLEDDPTNVLKISSFYLCIEDAVQCDQYEILTYLLSQGILLDILDVAMAVRRKKRRALEIYMTHGWNINDPRTDLQPPLLRYVVNFNQGIPNLHGTA